MGAALSLTTYGTPTAAAPLVFQGYTSTAGDGGIGEISGAATYGIYTGTSFVHFADMKIGSCGAAAIYDGAGSLINCELYGSTNGSAVFVRSSGTNEVGIAGCYIHTITGQYPVRMGAGNVTGGYVFGNYFDISPTTAGLFMSCYGGTVANNIIKIGGADTSIIGVYCERSTTTIRDNTIYCTNANTVSGVKLDGIYSVVMNNIIAGWSGAGGAGVHINSNYALVGANAFYNCTTNVSGTPLWRVAADISLGSSPFVNAAGGDFEIDGASDASEAAWPSAWKGLSTTANLADIGAVQSGAGAGGGGGPVIGSRVIRGLGAI